VRTRLAPRRATAALLVLGVAVIAPATVSAVADPGCPEPAGNEEQILDGEVLIKLTEFPGSGAKEGCVLGFIPAAPQSVMAVLRQAEHYDEYMPRVEKSDVASGPDGEILNTQELDLPWPIGDRHFTVRLVEQREKDGSYRFNFNYVPGSGNILDTRGHWLIEPWHGGSRVTYSLWTDPGGMIPKWAVNRASRQTLPDVIVALRDRVADDTHAAAR
jgi:hypothetical protein